MCFALKKTPGEGFLKNFPALMEVKEDFAVCGQRQRLRLLTE